MLYEISAARARTAFGDYREHFRIALTVPKEEIELGLKNICEALK